MKFFILGRAIKGRAERPPFFTATIVHFANAVVIYST